MWGARSIHNCELTFNITLDTFGYIREEKGNYIVFKCISWPKTLCIGEFFIMGKLPKDK